MATDLFSLQWITTDNLPHTKPDYFELPHIDASTPLFLQYTSGSTGAPKGVIVTHRSVTHNIRAIQYCLNIQEHDILYSWLPQYHDMGLIGCILTPLYTGLCTILSSPLNFLIRPASWLQGISKYQCTISAAPNFAYELCANKVTTDEKQHLNLSSWRSAVNSAEPIRASTLQNFYNQFKECGFKEEAFYPSYGLAEATLFVTTKSLSVKYHSLVLDKEALQAGQIKIIAPDHKNAQHFISSGDIDANVKEHQLIIVNPETCMPVDEEQIGEVWISSHSVNPGYWKQKEETQRVFKGYLQHGDTSYLKTGDLGFINAGQLYITGRMKDLIIIRGRNYYPQDIEFTAEKAHPAVRAGCINAFAVVHDNLESLFILVEVKTEQHYQEIATAIRNQVLEQHALSPAAIVLLAPKTLKKTTSGKVKRREMKKCYLAGELPILFCWQQNHTPCEPAFPKAQQKEATQTKDELELVVMNALKHILRDSQLQEIPLNSKLSELGFDSLLTAELISHLQSQLPEKIELSLADIIEKNFSIEELLRHIKTQMNGSTILSTQYQPESNKIYSLAEQRYWMDVTHLADFEKLKHSREILGEKNANLLYFNVTNNISENTIQLHDREYINFSGYNYLGYAGDPRVIAATQEAISLYGTSVSASRLISGQKPIHNELEQEIASLIGTEDSIVFTAGHATNVSVITHLYNSEDVIFHDALIHNSSLQGAIFSKAKRIAFPHNDYGALTELLQKKRHAYRRALILIEGVYSMDGDIPNVPEFVTVKNQYHAHLMIDEAHSLGVIGQHGGGIREYFNLNADDVDLWMGTLSKAFASCGGYVAGKRSIIEYLKFTCGGFVFSAGMTPANAAAALASIRLLKQEPFRPRMLQQRTAQLLMHLQKHHINTGASHNTPIIPIIVGDEHKAIDLSLALREQGIYTIPIIYPAVDKGAARIRLFMNYLHSEEQIIYTTEMICNYMN